MVILDKPNLESLKFDRVGESNSVIVTTEGGE